MAGYELRNAAISYLGEDENAPWDISSLMGKISLGAFPDKVFGIETVNILGWSAVAMAGMTAYVITRRVRRRKRK